MQIQKATLGEPPAPDAKVNGATAERNGLSGLTPAKAGFPPRGVMNGVPAAHKGKISPGLFDTVSV